MTVRLTPVTRDDVLPLIALRLAPDRAHFVSDNAKSLAEAAYELSAYPFVVWSDDTRVGFALMKDWGEADHLEEGDDPEAVFLWRLMMGDGQDGKGFGTAAMSWLIKWAQDRGAKRFVLSHMVENDAAAAFYAQLGFRPNGRMRYGGEDVELALTL